MTLLASMVQAAWTLQTQRCGCDAPEQQFSMFQHLGMNIMCSFRKASGFNVYWNEQQKLIPEGFGIECLVE